MKTLKFIFTTVVFMLSIVCARAYDFTVDGISYNYVFGTADQVSVTYNEYYSGDIVIPEQVSWDNKTYMVTAIGFEAFSSSRLNSLTMPNTIQRIDSYAFAWSSLRVITLPESVTTISESDAFYNSQLTAINVSENNPVYASVDGVLYNKAVTILYFYPPGRTDKDFSMPNSVTTIGAYAFEYCSNLASITLSNSLTTIGEWVFYGCRFSSSFKIPQSVISIGSNSFSNTSVETFEVEDNNPKFSAMAGSLYNKDKTSLLAYTMGKKDSSFVVPSSVISIGDYAFQYCTYLTSITLPESLTSIGYASFESSGLKTVTIPASVETIGGWAFTKCPNLKTIVFEGAIKNMGGEIFADWGFVPRAYDLEVKCPPFTVPSYFSSDFDLDKSTLTVPAGTKSLFESAPVWQDFNNIIEKSPTAIIGIDKEETNATVYISGNNLHIDSPYNETVQIYVLTGKLLYTFTKPVGKISYPVSSYGVLIVKGSCWVKKVM